jgi:Flp pilus assembly pilin Flp
MRVSTGGSPGGCQAGQGLVEYSLILALSALVALVVLVVFGPTLSDILEIIGRLIDEAS